MDMKFIFKYLLVASEITLKCMTIITNDSCKFCAKLENKYKT